ncbi:MAG: type II secretion system F family protein [Candidatus Diapherotrites archaeon]|nr:type II secretion system F family protein [Candidatus Diapherotrites archaeon]
MIEKFFGKEKAEDFEAMLLQNNPRNSLKKFFESSLAEGALILLLGLALAFELQLGEEFLFALPIIAFIVPLFANYFFQSLVFEKRKREIEEAVPDVLLQAASMPSNSSFSNIAEYLSRQDFGSLSKEFEKAKLEVEKGAAVQEALGNISKRCNSPIVERMALLLKQGFESGNDLSSVFRETAEDIIETRTILKERSAALALQKMTLLFAGALIVPLVLGLISGLIKGFDFAQVSELGIGLAEAQRKELIQTALTTSQLYIIEFAILASIFAAFIDSNLKKSVIYAALLIPAGLAAFYIAGAL